MSHMRLVFMGTPDFAVPSLGLLLASQYEVAAVITTPDKPQGRGKKITSSPIKLAALAHKLPVLQPTNLQDPAFLAALSNYQADLQVVVAFRMLPRAVWDMPTWGTFNLHASLLPAYRGAAPINWAIINGEEETGLTTFLIEENMDTGQVIFQEKEPIFAHDTAGTLYERLKYKGAQLVLKTVKAIEKGNHTAMPQVPTQASLGKKAPKLYKENCQINWNKTATAVINFIRGLSPYPAAWTTFNNQTYKILSAEIAPSVGLSLNPGEFRSDGKRYLCVGTQTDPIAIQVLQPAGKKPMDAQAFLRGHQLE